MAAGHRQPQKKVWKSPVDARNTAGKLSSCFCVGQSVFYMRERTHRVSGRPAHLDGLFPSFHVRFTLEEVTVCVQTLQMSATFSTELLCPLCVV